ncbi:hypothetical protein LOK49_LG04G00822 [Camellia lanceoleosa]|uniref:Uncharacterized protein n=1 Tax=Camellia lanceoleosa TaxID=1840588 RepID=A0ACC0I486_9ERIC|nr:hypothetical protein LOK49_LG04G00822 [Camellia lanceoleosa]
MKDFLYKTDIGRVESDADVKMLVGELVYQVLIVTELSPFRGAFNYEPIELDPRWRVVLVGLKPIGNNCSQCCTCVSSVTFVHCVGRRKRRRHWL